MSWLFSQALVEAYLPDSRWGGERSAPLNVMPTQHPFWRRDKTMESWSRFPFGPMSQVLPEDLGQDVLMSFRRGFPARTSVPREAAPASTVKSPASGWKWSESQMKYDPDTCSWKTRQCSLLGGLEKFSETWPRWGTMRNGECWEQPMWGLRISGTGFGLLPTPVADAAVGTSTTKTAQGGTPLNHVSVLYPTITAKGNYNRKGASATSGDGLETFVKKYPICQSRDWKGMSGRSLKGEEMDLPSAVGGSLNPTWVEWLMGWPIGWTELDVLEMVRYPYAPQPLGVCSRSA